MTDTTQLKQQLKQQIIEQLALEEVKVDDINDDDPLFGENGLNLDSIDALEFIVLLDTHYQIKISDPSKGRSIFYSINTLTDYIVKNRS